MIIYKTTNLINGKIYVGYDTKNRYSINEYAGSGKILWNAIEKYGLENFKKEILEDNIEDFKFLQEREIFWIKELNSHILFGNYNLTWGGEGGDTLTHNPNLNNIKRKISDKVKGVNHPNFGKHFTQETKSRISLSNKGKRKHFTQETIDKIKNNNKKRSKSVCQYDLNGNFIKKYESMTEASIVTNTERTRIVSVCKGDNITANGYMWRYENDILDMEAIRQRMDRTGEKNSNYKSNKRSKLILQYDKDMNIVDEYISVTDAARQTNLIGGLIDSVCKGYRKTHGGFIWKFKEKED